AQRVAASAADERRRRHVRFAVTQLDRSRHRLSGRRNAHERRLGNEGDHFMLLLVPRARGHVPGIVPGAVCQAIVPGASASARARCPVLVPGATCSVPRATSYVLDATCYMRRATCDMRHATCDMRHATCDVRRATSYVSSATRQMHLASDTCGKRREHSARAPGTSTRHESTRHLHVARGPGHPAPAHGTWP